MVAAARRASAWVLAAALLAASCASSEPAPAAGTPRPLVVDVWWSRGYQGKLLHRALWVSSGDPSNPDWQQFPLDVDEDVEGPLAPLSALAAAEKAARAELADAACDRVTGACAAELTERRVDADRLRRSHSVVADRLLQRAVILDRRAIDLGIIDLVTGARTPLPLTMTTDYSRATWSRDGRRLAIAHQRRTDGDTAGAQLFVIAAETGEHLYAGEVAGFVYDMAWSSDGARLAIMSLESRTGDSGFIERFYANLGHGRPYSDIVVQLVDVDSGLASEQELAHDLPETEVSLVWDPCEAP
ncbi:MAG TPA: hypothetical protein VFY71_07355 [Planctomycetota bacterium]|nr:hypothetical protein [Planctomycetota bacterium]